MFQDKVVWITGASSGIGAELAYEFARAGSMLVLSARRLEKLQTVAARCSQLGARVLSVSCDVSQEADVENAINQAMAFGGRIDIAIANAGIGISGSLENLSADEWKKQFDVNVIGLVLTARHVLPYLKQTGGRLVLLGSVAAYLPSPNTVAYGASKAAVRSIGQTLQIELKDSGVSCTVIHPGFVESEIARVDNEGVFHPDRPDPRPGKLMWPADKAARVIARAIYQRRKSFVFTGHGRVGAFLGQHFPALAIWIVGRAFPRPKSS